MLNHEGRTVAPTFMDPLPRFLLVFIHLTVNTKKTPIKNKTLVKRYSFCTTPFSILLGVMGSFVLLHTTRQIGWKILLYGSTYLRKGTFCDYIDMNVYITIQS